MYFERPAIFISHRGEDKPRLEPFLERVLLDGVAVQMDQGDAFSEGFRTRIVRFKESGLFRTFPVGREFSRAMYEHSTSSSCTIGFVSNGSASVDPLKPHYQLQEMVLAFDRKRLVVVELDQGSLEKFGEFDMDANIISKMQRAEMWNGLSKWNYDDIAQAVARVTQGAIRLGERQRYDELAHLQSELANRLRGSPAFRTVTYFDLGMPFPFQLIPGHGPDGEGFYWFSRQPYNGQPVSMALVHDALARAPNFRLPTAEEVAWATSPISAATRVGNPFGVELRSHPAYWVAAPQPEILDRHEMQDEALLHLIYVRGKDYR